MWTTLEESEKLTLEDNMEEIMRRVQRLHITDASIQDRFVVTLHTITPPCTCHGLTVSRLQVFNSQ